MHAGSNQNIMFSKINQQNVHAQSLKSSKDRNISYKNPLCSWRRRSNHINYFLITRAVFNFIKKFISKDLHFTIHYIIWTHPRIFCIFTIHNLTKLQLQFFPILITILLLIYYFPDPVKVSFMHVDVFFFTEIKLFIILLLMIILILIIK